MGRVAVYAGSFDPVTLGHEDIVRRCVPLFDRIYVAVGVNSAKTPFMTLERRMELLKESFKDLQQVYVDTFVGLQVDYCRQVSANFIIRGLRAVTDFEYELGIAHANSTQAPDIESIFVPTRPELSFISSSVVRELAKHKGNISRYVSPHVAEALNVWKGA